VLERQTFPAAADPRIPSLVIGLMRTQIFRGFCFVATPAGEANSGAGPVATPSTATAASGLGETDQPARGHRRRGWSRWWPQKKNRPKPRRPALTASGGHRTSGLPGPPRETARKPPAGPEPVSAASARRPSHGSVLQQAVAAGQRRHPPISITIGWGCSGPCCFSCSQGPDSTCQQEGGLFCPLQISGCRRWTTENSAAANSSSERQRPGPCAGTPTHSWASSLPARICQRPPDFLSYSDVLK